MRAVHQAVILAAGKGSRLNGSNNGSAKCMAKVGDATLIEHQIRILRSFGVERIVVVVGHEADAVRACAGDDCVFVENTQYAETNSLYSLWLARQAVTGSFLLMNCDVLAHPDVYRRLFEADGTALTFDSGSGDEPEHMKVHIAEGMLQAISKELPSCLTRGENVGILRFDKDDVSALFQAAGEFIERGQLNMWSPAAVGRLSRSRPVRCIDVADLDWVEIDFPEDLERARTKIWPAVEPLIAQAANREAFGCQRNGQSTNGSRIGGYSANGHHTNGHSSASKHSA